MQECEIIYLADGRIWVRIIKTENDGKENK